MFVILIIICIFVLNNIKQDIMKKVKYAKTTVVPNSSNWYLTPNKEYRIIHIGKHNAVIRDDTGDKISINIVRQCSHLGHLYNWEIITK